MRTVCRYDPCLPTDSVATSRLTGSRMRTRDRVVVANLVYCTLIIRLPGSRFLETILL